MDVTAGVEAIVLHLRCARMLQSMSNYAHIQPFSRS